jgi:dCMP deaminase
MEASSRNSQFDNVYMNIAKEISKLSYCKRAQVGAVIVNNSNINSFGYNGTLSGEENTCEDIDPLNELVQITRPTVVHAEMNAILKSAKFGMPTVGSTMYCTLSPCENCAKAIIQAGIKRVVYLQEYSNNAGIEMMKNHIEVEKL